VTNAFWARSEGQAMRVLQPLAEAGLFDIVVSYDDNHAPFIREDNIVDAFRAAAALDVKFSIIVCMEPGCVIDRCYVERMLGLEEGQAEVNIVEFWINSTGRAKDEDSPEKQRRRRGRPEALLGPCYQVLQQPTLMPTGKIQPCCGFISYKEGLVVGDIGTDTLLQALQRAYQNPLLKWIAFDGPGAVLERITEGTPNKITTSDLDGNCHACDLLFSNPTYLDLAQATAEGPLSRILALQESYLVRAGMFRYPGCAPSPNSV
jgi:hypothetical protein